MSPFLPDPGSGSSGPDSDPFKPPPIVTVVRCLHCDQEYDSFKIHWVEDASFGVGGGYWACSTPGCDGKGFCFDIWPTDPEWRDENGEKVWFDDAEPEGDEDDADGFVDDDSDSPL
jgi:hypothetical protein